MVPCSIASRHLQNYTASKPRTTLSFSPLWKTKISYTNKHISKSQTLVCKIVLFTSVRHLNYKIIKLQCLRSWTLLPLSGKKGEDRKPVIHWAPWMSWTWTDQGSPWWWRKQQLWNSKLLQTKHHNNPQDNHLHTHGREDLKSHRCCLVMDK